MVKYNKHKIHPYQIVKGLTSKNSKSRMKPIKIGHHKAKLVTGRLVQPE